MESHCFNGHTWVFMEIHGSHGNTWVSKKINTWFSMDIHGFERAELLFDKYTHGTKDGLGTHLEMQCACQPESCSGSTGAQEMCSGLVLG